MYRVSSWLWLWPEQSQEFVCCHNLSAFYEMFQQRIWNLTGVYWKCVNHTTNCHNFWGVSGRNHLKVYTSHNDDSSWLQGQSHAWLLTLTQNRVMQYTGLVCFRGRSERGWTEPSLGWTQQFQLIKKKLYLLRIFNILILLLEINASWLVGCAILRAVLY